MNLNNMKKVILVGLMFSVFTSQSMAQSMKAVKTLNSTKDAVAKVVTLDPIDVVAEYVSKKKNAVSDLYAQNAVNTELSEASVDTGRKTDTTEIKVGKTRIVVIGEPKIEKIYMEKDSTGDFEEDRLDAKKGKHEKKNDGELEFSIGYNGFLENGSTSLSAANRGLDLVNGKSLNVNLTYNHYFNIYKENVRVSAGLGLDWNNYRLSGDSSLTANAPKLTFYQDSANGQPINFSKNKLLARYATMPVMIHFKTNPNKKGNSLGASAGVELGYLINGRLKQVSDAKGKQKVNDNFNFNELRYGFIGRVSYGSVGIYGKYYPQSAFNKNEGPDLNTFVLGLTFGLD
jgi:hypothetical protein